MDLKEAALGPSARHPWELARAVLVEELMASRLSPGAALLDVGCGDGYTGLRLARRSGASWVGVDQAFSASRPQQDSYRFLADIDPARRFDALLLLDVLEHVKEDGAFLREALTKLRPGAWVLITVPAWPALYSAHDRFLAHERRYRPREIRALIEDAGLVSRLRFGAFFSLLLLRVLGRLWPQTASSGVAGWRWPSAHPLTKLLERLLLLDVGLARILADIGIYFPGLSHVELSQRGHA